MQWYSNIIYQTHFAALFSERRRKYKAKISLLNNTAKFGTYFGI